MKFTEFDYDVFVMVQINGHELGFLQRLSQQHYDAKCQAAGRVGGFLYGFINQWMLTAEGDYSFGDDLPDPPSLDRDEIIKMSGHQLGTLGKICEINTFAYHGEPEPPLSAFNFVQLLRKRRDEYNRLTEEAEETEDE
jgi:hypothetical protein